MTNKFCIYRIDIVYRHTAMILTQLLEIIIPADVVWSNQFACSYTCLDF